MIIPGRNQDIGLKNRQPDEKEHCQPLGSQAKGKFLPGRSVIRKKRTGSVTRRCQHRQFDARTGFLEQAPQRSRSWSRWRTCDEVPGNYHFPDDGCTNKTTSGVGLTGGGYSATTRFCPDMLPKIDPGAGKIFRVVQVFCPVGGGGSRRTRGVRRYAKACSHSRNGECQMVGGCAGVQGIM